jgi:uncharacterized peroxidase-related enzyme
MIKINAYALILLTTSSIPFFIKAERATPSARPHISVREDIPGIRSLFLFRPETARPLIELSDILLARESSLSRAEREIIASFVSYLNECKFCCTIHTAIAVHLLDGDAKTLQAVKDDYLSASISEKLKTLLTIAAKVQKNARSVTDEDVQRARDQGATDIEIHDAVLIAAAFCMYNRYVDGLRVWTPDDPKMYAERAALVAQHGYTNLHIPALKKIKKQNSARPHISVQEDIPGIRSLLALRPEIAKVHSELVGTLLGGESTLLRAEREIIAAFVSYLNECKWCCTMHTAVAVHLLDGEAKVLQAVKDDYLSAPISEKLKTLLTIAAKVQKNARSVADEDIQHARDQGATDIEIHDTVLIAAVFCMNNRYVDGLRAWTPDDPKIYEERAALIAQHGYGISTKGELKVD